MLISRGAFYRNLKCWEPGLEIREEKNQELSQLQIESFNWLKTKAQSVYLLRSTFNTASMMTVPGVKRGHAGGCAGLFWADGLCYSLVAAEVGGTFQHYYSGQSEARHPTRYNIWHYWHRLQTVVTTITHTRKHLKVTWSFGSWVMVDARSNIKVGSEFT